MLIMILYLVRHNERVSYFYGKATLTLHNILLQKKNFSELLSVKHYNQSSQLHGCLTRGLHEHIHMNTTCA